METNKNTLTRAAKFGDGLFETMRWQSGKLMFLQAHFERLEHGLKILGIAPPKEFSAHWLESTVRETLQKHTHANLPYARVRMTFWRTGAGLYLPEENDMAWVVEFGQLAAAQYQLPEKGLLVGKYDKVRLCGDILSPLKTLNALPYIMAAKYKQEHADWDDCLLLNSEGRIAEAISSNIFLRIGEVLYTPSLQEGCVSGVMRRILKEIAIQHHLRVEETALLSTHFVEADELWLCNVIQGIRPVKQISFMPQKLFHHDWAPIFLSYLNERLAAEHL